eukprot:1146237-Pelagomonas_calceolata.AAC.5
MAHVQSWPTPLIHLHCCSCQHTNHLLLSLVVASIAFRKQAPAPVRTYKRAHAQASKHARAHTYTHTRAHTHTQYTSAAMLSQLVWEVGWVVVQRQAVSRHQNNQNNREACRTAGMIGS